VLNLGNPPKANNSLKVSSSQVGPATPVTHPPPHMLKYSMQFQGVANLQQELYALKQQRLPKTRPQEPFHKRVNDIEKKAKALEQDREEQQDQYDVNEFFEEQ
jgi:hypothetical protein